MSVTRHSFLGSELPATILAMQHNLFRSPRYDLSTPRKHHQSFTTNTDTHVNERDAEEAGQFVLSRLAGRQMRATFLRPVSIFAGGCESGFRCCLHDTLKPGTKTDSRPNERQRWD